MFVGQEGIAGGILYYAVVLQAGNYGLPDFSDAILKRMECIKIISGLPMEALEEAAEALSDISQFYIFQQQVKATPALTSSTEINNPLRAELGRVYDREEFYLSEE